ncbi:site-specific integrase [Deinococcus sp.]|uniref:tyrosine-type recombinase/integrase n=1 Tax=Deinococcus sp. TaxID=47478 RepID=UPI0025BECF4D|nr:site-specific integrase [Deinococcus sp.]
MLPSPSHLKLLLERQQYEEFFNELLPHISDKLSTRKNVLSGWRIYIRFLEETGESLLNFQRVGVEYAQWLKAQDVAPATLNNRLTQVRKLYALLLTLELVQVNPFLGTVGERNPVDERREIYSSEEVQRLLAHADAQERLLILLATEAGLSGSEVRRLKFGDLLADGAELRIWRVRYRQDGFEPVQVVKCSEVLQDALGQWLKVQGAAPLFESLPEGFLFEVEGRALTDPELLSRLYSLCQRANVIYKPWRALRHVAGVQQLAAGTDKVAVQEQVGVRWVGPLAKRAGLVDGRKLRWKKR